MKVLTNQEKTTIVALVPDVMLHIFSLLNVAERQNVAQVCTDWWSIAYHPSLWRRVEPVVKKAIPDSDPWSCKGDERVVKKRKYPMLASLLRRGIKRVKVEDSETLIHITRHMPGLKSLTIHNIYSPEEHGPSARALHLAFNIKLDTLSSLNLNKCYKISNKHVKLIVRNAASLTHLDLTHCRTLDNRALLHVSQLTQLRMLILRGCGWLTHEGIGHLAKINQSLQWLDVRFCHNLCDEALRLISVGLTGLRHLDLTNCIQVTDAGLKHLGEMANSQITWLDISYCQSVPSQGLQHLTALGQLEELHMIKCSRINSTCMHHVAKISSLRILNLSGSRMNESDLSVLARASLKLIELHVRLTGHVTDDCCISLSLLTQLQTLMIEMVYDNCDISDKGVDLFTRSDSSLVKLRLWCNDWVRDSTFVFLARMKRLRVLQVIGSPNFNVDAAILNLVNGGSQLEKLRLFSKSDDNPYYGMAYTEERFKQMGLFQVTKLARLRKFIIDIRCFPRVIMDLLDKSGICIDSDLGD